MSKDSEDHYEIVTLKSGSLSLRSRLRQETFHPTSGPLGEARILHTDQQRLRERSEAHDRFIIWDVGLGAAANTIAAIDALKGSQKQSEIHSFDKTTSALEFALEHSRELDYVKGYEDQLRQLVDRGRVSLRPGLTWYLHLGDFKDALAENRWSEVPAAHAVFYDPYSPATNPEMWTLEHFERLYGRLDQQDGCLLTNYTRSTAMRVALLLAGFSVGVGAVIGEKAETTIASTRLELLQSPLTQEWLKRVKNSTNGAPLRASSYTKSAISAEDFERLLKLPQFS